MTNTTETQIALHEQRLNTLELAYPRFENKIDLILEKLTTTVVTKVEYEKDVKAQKAVNKVVEEELETIKSMMVTRSQMEGYQKSQLWQRIISAIGGMMITILGAVILWELAKVIK